MEFNFTKNIFTHTRYYLSIAFLSLLIPINCVAEQNANEAKIAIIYPQVREPYSSIFKEIIRGVVETTPNTVEQYSITKKTNTSEIKSKLDQSGIELVILLGNYAQKMSPTLAKEKTVLTGAVFSTPSVISLNSSSISMLASPEVLLEELITLAPQVKTVHVVYNKEKDAWLIKLAEPLLRQKNIRLNALVSEDMRTHARLYNGLFKSQTLSKTDAVWLLQSDRSIKEPRVFASLLESAWKQKFIVFSSNPTHVRKGTLFAMYPDNRKLGVSLANKILSLRNGKQHSIDPLEDLLVAVNIRTAEHLELDFSRTERQRFNMVFPSR